MGSKDSKDYDYVVNLLKKDAQARANAHKSQGVAALHEPAAKRTSRPDTRFLERVMRSQGLVSARNSTRQSNIHSSYHSSKSRHSGEERNSSGSDRHSSSEKERDFSCPSTSSSYKSSTKTYSSSNSNSSLRSNRIADDHRGRHKPRDYSPAESHRVRRTRHRSRSPPLRRRKRHRERSRSPSSRVKDY